MQWPSRRKPAALAFRMTYMPRTTITKTISISIDRYRSPSPCFSRKVFETENLALDFQREAASKTPRLPRGVLPFCPEFILTSRRELIGNPDPF